MGLRSEDHVGETCKPSASAAGRKYSVFNAEKSLHAKKNLLNPFKSVVGNLNKTLIPKGTFFRLKRRVVILGCGPLALEVYRVLSTKRRTTSKVIGFVDQEPSQVATQFGNSQILGAFDNLSELVQQFDVHTIVVCVEDRRSVLPVQALLNCKTIGIEVIDGHQIYEDELGRLSIDQLRPSALIFSAGFKRKIFTRGIKRSVDLVFSTIGLVLLLPLCFLIGLIIRMDSPGGIFYRQMRVGLYGQSYLIWKFRSMYEDAEKGGPQWAKKEDPRVTRVGRILRKLRIDELPQLYNVLRGEMSLVGPRPERPIFVEELKAKIPYYDIRHTVRPGLTGWAQIRFRYGSSENDAHTKLQYDLYYVKNLNLWLDFRILAETVRVVFFGEGAR